MRGRHASICEHAKPDRGACHDCRRPAGAWRRCSTSAAAAAATARSSTKATSPASRPPRDPSSPAARWRSTIRHGRSCGTIARRRLVSPVAARLVAELVQRLVRRRREPGSRRFALRRPASARRLCAMATRITLQLPGVAVATLCRRPCPRPGRHPALPQCRLPVPGRRLCLPSRLPRAAALCALRRARRRARPGPTSPRSAPSPSISPAMPRKRDAHGGDSDVADPVQVTMSAIAPEIEARIASLGELASR